MTQPAILNLRKRPRIVIPIVAGIGNALLAAPLVRQLKNGLPDCELIVIARIAAMGQVFERLAEVDQVLIMRPGALGMARSMLLTPRPNVCLIPFPSNRWQYMMLAISSGARFRLMHGYPTPALASLAFVPAIRVPAVRGLHDVAQNLNLLKPFGIEPDTTMAPEFPLRPDDRQSADEMLRAVGVADSARPIIIHAGSAQTILAAAKRWPAGQYAALIDAIHRLYSDRVVLVEGPDELGVADEIVRQCELHRPAVLPLRGALSQTAAVLARSRLYVGSDSGLAHLAAAVHTPPVTLFAPSDPQRCSPFGYRRLVVQPRNKACAPCFEYPYTACRPKMKCRPPMCIEAIHVEDVLAAVKLALG